MPITYKSLSKRSHLFLRLTGLKVEEFNRISKIIKPIYEKERIKRVKDNTGRISNIKTIEDKLICLFMYYRCYITHEFLGYLFNLHNSNICRLFKILEPIVAKKIHIEKDKTLTKEIVEQLIVDVTEQPIQRPKNKKKQKEYYSGKKKKHTIKKQIIIDDKGKITQISKTYKGKDHDFKIFKDSDNLKSIERNAKILADSGYQGIKRYKTSAEIPIKRHKIKDNDGNIIIKTGLTKEEKTYNHNLSSKRIKVENKFRELKVFKILSDTYRNFTKKHDLRFNIIAGLVNHKNGFLRLT
jgi:transposase